MFLILLWLSLLIAFGVLATLLVTIFVEGSGKLTPQLFTDYPSASPDTAGARPAVLGSVWVIVTTAVLTIPLGIAAAIHLEEFADKKRGSTA